MSACPSKRILSFSSAFSAILILLSAFSKSCPCRANDAVLHSLTTSREIFNPSSLILSLASNFSLIRAEISPSVIFHTPFYTFCINLLFLLKAKIAFIYFIFIFQIYGVPSEKFSSKYILSYVNFPV